MSEALPTISTVADIIDLRAWRDRKVGGGSAPVAARGDRSEIARLEAAIERLQPLVSRALGAGALAEDVETELLAIMGQLTVGLVDDAAERAERLARDIAADGAGG